MKREPGLIAKIDVTALHLEYRRGHGFESRLSTIFFFHFGPKFKHDSFSLWAFFKPATGELL